MIFTSLDSICKSTLLRKRYTMHFYLDALLAAVTILREITLDDLQVVRFHEKPVNAYNAVDIPDGTADVVSVGVKVGQRVRMLTPDDTITRLNNFDSSLNIVKYSNSVGGMDNGYFLNSLYGDTCLGYTRTYADTYKVIKERNEIQLNEAITDPTVIVVTVGDGRDADAATRIETDAEATIEAFIFWQFAEMSNSPEKERLRQMYISERKILRARRANWDFKQLRRIVQREKNSWVNAGTPALTAATPTITPTSIAPVVNTNVVTLLPGATSYVVPADTLIDDILFITTAITVSIGTTVGGVDIAQPFTIAAGAGTFQAALYFANTTTIYFTGVTSTTIIKIYKR